MLSIRLSENAPLIEMMNCEERPPDKRDRSRARGRKVFGQIRTFELRISARIRQFAKMAFGDRRCMIAQNYAEITRTHEVSKSGSSPVGYPAPSPTRLFLRRVLSGPRGRRSGNRFSTQPAMGLATWLKARGESSTSLPILPDSDNHCNGIGVEIPLQLCMFSATFWAGEIQFLVVSSPICACSSTG